ncbi:MAG: ABC-F family ATP-binding cassette domain-containing protein [Anaerolineae bacterium]|nr:ABC-F family ATP-binding cassette domain-containing protein [Anaerolineae bacterium]
MSVLTFHDLTQSFGALDVFVGLSGSVARDARIGLVGPNGIGKTTLLRILAGEERASEGSVYTARGARIGYLQQEAARAFSDPGHTVYQEALTVFAGLRAQEAELRRMEAEMASGSAGPELLQAYGAMQAAFELAGGYEYEVRIRQVLTGLGFEPAEHGLALGHCSGGQKTRALLARLLLERPDLLILDEPTNHLDMRAVEWLESALRSWEGALLVVSHDRYFLDRVANAIWEMGTAGLEVYRGDYSAYLRQRGERWARRESEFESTRERFLRELDYVKRNIARSSTTDQAKGRLRRLARQVKAVEQGGVGILQSSWLAVTEQVAVSKTKWNVAQVEQHIKALVCPNPSLQRPKVRLHAAVRGGNIVMRTRGLAVGYSGKALFDTDGDLELRRGERAALIGPNGAGKTTLLKTVLGEVEALAGEVQLGAHVETGYYAQAQDMLSPGRTVLETLMAERTMDAGSARALLARYLFHGDDVFKPVEALSGGERSRLALALLSLQQANLLLLDEPTNHLDIPAQEVLEEALRSFGGTVVMVSHDRYLVDALATQVWELREGRLHVYKGGYASYLVARELDAVGAAPVRQGNGARDDGVRGRLTDGARGERDLFVVEAEIEALERALDRTGGEMELAAGDAQWHRVRSLERVRVELQNKLDALLVQWESLAPA